MPVIKWTFRLGLIAVLGYLLWLLWQQNTTTQPKQTINTISRTTTTPSAVEPTHAEPSPKPKSQMLSLQLPDGNPADDRLIKPNPDRPYLLVYREWQQALQCEPYYHREHANQGLLNIEDYMSLRQGRPMEQIEPWDDTQTSHFMDFLRRCEQLKKTTFGRLGIQQRYPDYVGLGPYVYPVVSALKKELQRTPAKTPAEQSLKATLALKKQWLAVAAELLEVSKGMLLLDADQIAAMQQEINELSEQLEALDPSMESAELMEQQIEILTPMIRLQNQIDQRGMVDTELRDAMVTQLLEMDTQLRDRLRSPHLDTFLEASQALEFTRDIDWRISTQKVPPEYVGATSFMPEYIAPSEVMFEMSGFKDRRYYDALIQPAALMWLCERGHDCSPTSAWVLNHCLGQPNLHHNPAACGLELPEFFKTQGWSQNQWTQAQPLWAMMENYYAP